MTKCCNNQIFYANFHRLSSSSALRGLDVIEGYFYDVMKGGCMSHRDTNDGHIVCFVLLIQGILLVLGLVVIFFVPQRIEVKDQYMRIVTSGLNVCIVTREL